MKVVEPTCLKGPNSVHEFQQTWVSHFKDMEVDVLEWNFNVGKTGEDTIFEMKAKVAIRQKT